MSRREVQVAYEEHGPSCAEGCSCKEPSIEERLSALEKKVNEGMGQALHAEADRYGLSEYFVTFQVNGETDVQALYAESPDDAASRFRKEWAPPGAKILRVRRAEANEPTGAYEYVATNSSGRVVFGPTNDYVLAKRHADMAGGVVKYEPRAREPESETEFSLPDPEWPGESVKVYVTKREAPRWGWRAEGLHDDGKSRGIIAQSAFVGFASRGEAIADVKRVFSASGASERVRRASEGCAHTHPPEVPMGPCSARELSGEYTFQQLADWANGVAKSSRRGGAPHLTGESKREDVIRWLKWNDPNGLYTDDANRREGQDPLTIVEAWGLVEDHMREDLGAGERRSPRFERCVRKVKARGDAVNPWAVCHAALGREPEPYTRKLHWHRTPAGNAYYNDDTGYGRITLRQRPSDKPNGKLAWYAVVRKIEVAQAETKAALQGVVEEHVRRPGAPAGAAECVQIVPQGDVDVIRRTPACSPQLGVRVDSPKHLHAAMRERVKGLGEEHFWCVGQSKQGEMIGQPVEIAVGEYDQVRVDVAKVIGTAATLRAAGAESMTVCHAHPSGHGHTPSEQDKDLTKRIRKGMDAIGMPFGGHYVLSEKHWARC